MLKVETVYGRTLVWVSRLPVTPLKTDELKAVGVDEVVLAINYQPEVMLNFLKDFEAKLEIKITCSQETERMGTIESSLGNIKEVNVVVALEMQGKSLSSSLLSHDIASHFFLIQLLVGNETLGSDTEITPCTFEEIESPDFRDLKEERDDEDEEQPEMERRGGGRGISNGGCGGAEQEEEEERRRRRADRDARRRRMK
ncbi:hypothetical protein Bca4012_097985 [Brassica carinata]